MTFDLKQLRAFMAVVECGSLGRASIEANVTQPALSRTIRDMEIRIGNKLFERQSKGMALTPCGTALVPHARHLLFEADQAMEAVAAVGGLKRGSARIGAVASVVRTCLPKIVEGFLRKWPGLKVQVVEGSDDQLIASLVGQQIDLAITGPQPQSDELEAIAECQFGDEYNVFAASAHPILQRVKPSFDDILQEGWVMPARNTAPRTLFEEIVRKAGKESPRIAIETSSPGAIASFVAHTSYLGWLPHPLFSQEEALGTVAIMHVPGLDMPRKFFVYRRWRGLLPEPACKLLNALPLVAVP